MLGLDPLLVLIGLYIIDAGGMVLVSDQNHCYLQIIIDVDSISCFTTSHFVFR